MAQVAHLWSEEGALFQLGFETLLLQVPHIAKYSNNNWQCWSPKSLSINLWKVFGALHSPNGIQGVWNPDFILSFSVTGT